MVDRKPGDYVVMMYEIANILVPGQTDSRMVNLELIAESCWRSEFTSAKGQPMDIQVAL